MLLFFFSTLQEHETYLTLARICKIRIEDSQCRSCENIFGERAETDLYWNFSSTLQDIVIETMLGGKSSVQGPFLLKLLFVGLKTMSPSVTAKHPAHCNIHCVPFKVSVMCSYHFSIRQSSNVHKNGCDIHGFPNRKLVLIPPR